MEKKKNGTLHWLDLNVTQSPGSVILCPHCGYRIKLRLIADAPSIGDVVPVVRCKDCVHFEDAQVNAKGFLICPNTGMDIWEECYCAHGERREQT